MELQTLTPLFLKNSNITQLFVKNFSQHLFLFSIYFFAGYIIFFKMNAKKFKFAHSAKTHGPVPEGGGGKISICFVRTFCGNIQKLTYLNIIFQEHFIRKKKKKNHQKWSCRQEPPSVCGILILLKIL